MSRKILFSPIGGTDPIKGFRDGSMLHICRHYLPDIVYLYLSHEMMEYHRKDNRYIDAIERLGVHLSHKFEVELIERDALIDVQQYDIFYQDFREEIRKIESEMENGDELLINMASGTPAMKSALLVLATLAEYRFRPIQVSTPKKSRNKEPDDRDSYDVEANWELNEDNEEGAENRCSEVKCLNLMKMLKVEAIKKHIQAYDYSAALSVAEEIKEDLSEDAYTMLQIADARIKLNLREISSFMGQSGNKFDIFPVKEGDSKKIFEYALGLQLKILKQEYADFVRGITPLTVDLLEKILKRECGVSLMDCCRKVYEKDKKTGEKSKEKWKWKWDTVKLRKMGLLKTLNNAYPNGFKGGDVYSTHLKTLILSLSDSPALNQKVIEITDIDRVRNAPAHEIISVTDQWIKKETGKTAQQIMEIIKYLLIQAGINVKDEYWLSYDKMNREIEMLLR